VCQKSCRLVCAVWRCGVKHIVASFFRPSCTFGASAGADIPLDFDEYLWVVFDPHFEDVRGGVEPWLMARWKAHNWTLFASSYKAKHVKTRCYQEGVGQIEPRFQGEGVVPVMGNIFGFYKTRHILLSDSANCTALRAVVLTQYRRVTDGQTDGRTDKRNCRS